MVESKSKIKAFKKNCIGTRQANTRLTQLIHNTSVLTWAGTLSFGQTMALNNGHYNNLDASLYYHI